MKQTTIDFIKGIVIGLGKVIPGVSGAIIAISLGVYEKGLQSLSKFTKKNIKFLINIGIGILLSIVIFSRIVIFSLDKHYLPTMLLFIGLIIGGSLQINKEIDFKSKQNVIIMITSMITLILLSKLDGNKVIVLDKNFVNYLMLVISGIIDALATVFPGISGTALLMIFGYYNIIMSSIGSIFEFQNIINNVFVLSAYSIGMLLGIVLFSKLMSYLFRKYRNQTYSGIFGFSVATIIILFKKTFLIKTSPLEIIVSLLLFLIGYLLSKKLAK